MVDISSDRLSVKNVLSNSTNNQNIFYIYTGGRRLDEANMALINPLVTSAWSKLALVRNFYKRIVIKFFWNIVNIVGYVTMIRESRSDSYGL